MLKSTYIIFLLILTQNTVLSQNFSAQIIKYSTFCEVGSNDISQIDSIVIQVNDRSGDRFTEIEIPYSKNERISDLNAWIENMDGTKVRSLKKNEIHERSAIRDASLYEDHFEKMFQLKHNKYPYRVIYTFRTSFSDYMSILSWTPIVYDQIPTKEATLKVKIPKKIQFRQFVNNILESKIDTSESFILLEWKASYNKPVQSEIFSQPSKLSPLIFITPWSFKYGIQGSMETWKSFGNWEYRLIKGLDILPDEEKHTVSNLINEITDKKEITKILYHYLQDHTHYVNVSIGIGGYKPYPASYVAEKKYGDCKALSNYMKALLSYANIESYYINVYASEQPRDVFSNSPGPQFNHAILAVPLEKDTVWLDNTAGTCPFGYLGTFTQNREALLISENNSRLVRTPSMKKEDTHVSYKLEFDLNTDGKAQLKMKNSFRGKDFERFNGLLNYTNDQEKDRYIREYMPFENYEVIDWGLKKQHRDTASIELNATLDLNKFLKPLGNEYYFNLYPVKIPSFTVAENRTLPVNIPYPISVSDTLIYNLPTGFELKTKSEPVEITSIYGNYSMKIETIQGKIKVVKTFELFTGKYPIEKYPEFYSFLKRVKAGDDKKLIIKPTPLFN